MVGRGRGGGEVLGSELGGSFMHRDIGEQGIAIGHGEYNGV